MKFFYHIKIYALNRNRIKYLAFDMLVVFVEQEDEDDMEDQNLSALF